MNIIIGVGTIFSMDEIDATAYGDLGTNTNSVMKMGINQTPQTLTITAPSTGGYSQVYLVQVIIQDIDSGATVLSYYNSSNPSQPYSGPANAGTSNFTTRLCQCTIALKAGVAAPTGSEVTPSPDAGYTGLYTITVVDGQSSITGADIVQLASAPFFPTLPAIPLDVLNGTFVYAGQDTGAANAYVITFGVGQPQPTRCADIPGHELFKYLDDDGEPRTIDSGDVNAYIKEIMHEDFTAKDFRTWAGTVFAALALSEFKKYASQAEAKRNVVAAIEKVARQLGNTPAICRRCYVHPEILNSYMSGELVKMVEGKIAEKFKRQCAKLNSDEVMVLAFLNKRLKSRAA